MPLLRMMCFGKALASCVLSAVRLRWSTLHCSALCSGACFTSVILALPALAATGVWTAGGGQGIYEHSVSTKGGSTFTMVNAVSAQLSAGTCAVSLEISGGNEPTGELQVFVGEDVFVFSLVGGNDWLAPRASRNEFFKLADALRTTKDKEFEVTMPTSDFSAKFSTRSAKKVLAGVEDGCD